MILHPHAKPGRMLGLVLSLLPFVVIIGFYIWKSEAIHRENPSYKLCPTVSQLIDKAHWVAFEKDRSEETWLWVDTAASGKRFLIALVFIFTAMIFGVFLGVFPYLDRFLSPFTLFVDKIQAPMVLPILLMTVGSGEFSKHFIIALGLWPAIALDGYFRARAVESEQVQTGVTLNGSGLEIACLIVLPQIFPQILQTLRVNLKMIFALLLFGESVAAERGLGYRVYLVGRYQDVATMIVYAFWVVFLVMIIDFLFRMWINAFRWQEKRA